MIIYLTGFMGSGKSTTAGRLAARLSVKTVEMDEELEREAGRTISQIFDEDGEGAFRDMESDLLRRIAQGDSCVVSCGGGAVLRSENVQVMKQSGKVVFLSAAPRTILERVRSSTDRPLLNGHMNIEDIAQMMAGRLPAYEAAADITVAVDERTPDDITEEIVRRIQDESGIA